MTESKVKRSNSSKTKHRFLHSVYRPSFLILLILFVLLPLSIFTYDFMSYLREFKDITKRLDLFDRKAHELLQEVSDNHDIKRYLQGDEVNPYEALYPIDNKYALETKFYLLSQDKQILASNNHKINFYNLESTYFNNSIFLNEHMKSTKVHFGRININELEVGYYEFSYIKGIYNEGKHIGTFILSLDDGFLNGLNPSLLNTIITDKQGVPLHVSNDYKFNSVFRVTDSSLKEYSQERKSYFKKHETNTMILWYFFDYQIYLKMIVFEIFFIILLRFVFKIVLTYVSFTTFENKIQLVDDIILGIEEFDKGNFQYRLNLTSNEQTNILVEKYNSLLEQVEQLVSKNIEIYDQKKLAELKQLQSQYNPHFLYNSLETIKYLSLTDPYKSFELTTNLGKLLRYNVDTQNDIYTSLQEELKYTEYYLQIQKERFEDMLNYYFLVDKNLLCKEIPKFIIQPLVENSIKHAYTGTQPLDIVIMLEAQTSGIWLYVMDNGQGMDLDTLKNVRKNMHHRGTINIGLYHTYQKLKLLYGEEVTMDIESNRQHGTNVAILLQKRDENVEDSRD